MGSLNVGIKESKMSQAINYRELKEQWKKDGEIPDWYSTNALQFFMDSYSYKGESVRSRDKTTCKYLADNSPHVYPSWWEEDGYTKGLNYEQVYFNVVYRDGYGVLSTPLKANGGLPERGMPISCSGQTLFNSVASKSFVIGEMEQLVKNAHGCAITIDGWLAEGTIYDDDGNMSEGVIPIIQEIQKKTEEINQGIRRGQTAINVNIEHGDFWKVADLLFEMSDKLNIGWVVKDTFIKRVEQGEDEALKRLAKVIYIRCAVGKGYILKHGTMNRNKADVFKVLGMEVHGSNLCTELNLPANDVYTFSCPIINANLSLYKEFPKHLFHILQIMQDANVTGYLKQLEAKKGYAKLYLSKIYEFTKDFRATGMGTCGFHTLLMQERIVYGSFESMLLNEEIFKRQRKDTYEASAWLADVLGVPDGLKRAGIHRRNATTMFAPPTKGSVELTRNTPSEGIGLQTAMIKVKETVGGDIFRIEKPFLDLLKERGMYTPEEVNRIAQNKGSVQDCDYLTEQEKAVFRNAFEISMAGHLTLCSQRQQYFDQQQSINIYVSSSDTEEYIGEIHKQALQDEGINSLYYCYSSRGGQYTRIKECEVCQ